jgi:hypothetical protein
LLRRGGAMGGPAFFASGRAQPPQKRSVVSLTELHVKQHPVSDDPHAPQKDRQGALRRWHFEQGTFCMAPGSARSLGY